MKYAFVFLALLLVACSTPAVVEDSTTELEDSSSGVVGESTNGNEPAQAPSEDVQETSSPDALFILTGENFAFFEDGREAPELRVKQGDLVRIEFTSTQGFHDWVVDEFDAATAKVREGEGMTSVEFVADKAGTFEYYCSVGSHRANGMVGNLVVE